MQLTDAEWRKIYNWIDYNAPDKGYFNANVLKSFPYQGYDQIERRKQLTDKYAGGAGVDWKKEIADYAAQLKNKGEIKSGNAQEGESCEGESPEGKRVAVCSGQGKGNASR